MLLILLSIKCSCTQVLVVMWYTGVNPGKTINARDFNAFKTVALSEPPRFRQANDPILGLQTPHLPK